MTCPRCNATAGYRAAKAEDGTVLARCKACSETMDFAELELPLVEDDA